MDYIQPLIYFENVTRHFSLQVNHTYILNSLLSHQSNSVVSHLITQLSTRSMLAVWGEKDAEIGLRLRKGILDFSVSFK